MIAQRVLVLTTLVAAVAGFVFASVSTSDFTAHLDRQVHAIHCSFIPGADTPDVSGTSGCHVTLMSPYSSVMRDSVWGGIPVALPAMAVFGYLAFVALALLVTRKDGDPRATGYLALAWGLPFLTSVVMGYLSLHELGAACRLCIGIYCSSTIGLVLAIVSWVRARSAWAAPLGDVDDEPAPKIRTKDTLESFGAADTVEAPPTLPDETEVDEEAGARIRLATASEMDRRMKAGRVGKRAPQRGPEPVSFGVLAGAFALGLVFVLVPVVAYASGAPDFSHYVGSCGTLAHPDASGGSGTGSVYVALGPQTRGVTMTEVLDPLCPSCRAFENRFAQHRAAAEVSRRAVLFPLDHDCNWMITESIHPGACVVSEAVLCAEGDAEEVLAWAFENQERIHEASQGPHGSEAVDRMVRAQFPALASCIGSATVEARLNRSLRWAVANQLPVLTPQIYVDDVRLCDEDTDLGLDYALSRLLDREEGGAR
ncbi:MAG: vitamin K epoxide reductase family protein [Sandaracinus sp.]